MSDKIYLGAILGADGNYYRGIFEDNLIEKYSAGVSGLLSSDKILEMDRNSIYSFRQATSELFITKITQDNHISDFVVDEKITIGADKSGSIGIDSNYLYVPFKDAKYTTLKYLRKYTRDTLVSAASISLTDAERVKHTLSDGIHIYCIFNGDIGIKKYNIETLELVSEISNAEGIFNAANACQIDEEYIYLGASGKAGVGNIQKINKETLEISSQSPIITSNTVTIIIPYEDFLYINMDKSIQKINKETLETVSTMPTLAVIWDVDEKHIYTSYQNFVYKYDRESLNLISQYKRDDETRSFDKISVKDGEIYTYTSKASEIKIYRNIYKLLGYERVS